MMSLVDGGGDGRGEGHALLLRMDFEHADVEELREWIRRYVGLLLCRRKTRLVLWCVLWMTFAATAVTQRFRVLLLNYASDQNTALLCHYDS